MCFCKKKNTAKNQGRAVSKPQAVIYNPQSDTIDDLPPVYSSLGHSSNKLPPLPINNPKLNHYSNSSKTLQTKLDAI